MHAHKNDTSGEQETYFTFLIFYLVFLVTIDTTLMYFIVYAIPHKKLISTLHKKEKKSKRRVYF